MKSKRFLCTVLACVVMISCITNAAAIQEEVADDFVEYNTESILTTRAIGEFEMTVSAKTKAIADSSLWETVLQSPYSVDFTEEQARYQIHEDLMQHEDGKEWALSRIGICEKPDPKFCDPFEYN